jgi:hypothetical protein
VSGWVETASVVRFLAAAMRCNGGLFSSAISPAVAEARESWVNVNCIGFGDPGNYDRALLEQIAGGKSFAGPHAGLNIGRRKSGPHNGGKPSRGLAYFGAPTGGLF